MQHVLKNHSMLIRSLKAKCAGILWITGLVLAGSDSDMMPWVNLGGLLLFFLASLMLKHRLTGRSSETGGQIIRPKAFSSSLRTQSSVGKSNRRVNTRYALSA